MLRYVCFKYRRSVLETPFVISLRFKFESFLRCLDPYKKYNAMSNYSATTRKTKP